MGLTQAHDLSELEIAEQKIEAQRKARRRMKKENKLFSHTKNNSKADSFLVEKQNNKRKRRQINSDSDDSG